MMKVLERMFKDVNRQDMKIEVETQDKARYMGLLLLADEQESMIARYLTRGDLFVMRADDGRVVCGCCDRRGRRCVRAEKLGRNPVFPEARLRQVYGRVPLPAVCLPLWHNDGWHRRQCDHGFVLQELRF